MVAELDNSVPNKQGNKRDTDIKNLLMCILTDFSYISEGRLHNLAFLCDYKHYVDYGERLSSADYYPYLKGCHSEQIDVVVEELRDIEKQKKNIGGERITTVKVKADFGCELDERGRNTVHFIANNYGDIPQEEIEKVIYDIEVYHEADSGEKIDFENI